MNWRKIFSLAAFVAWTFFFPWLVMGPFHLQLDAAVMRWFTPRGVIWESLGRDGLRLALFFPLALGGALLLKAGWPKRGWAFLLSVAILGGATAYRLATYLPDLSTYPFSLGWSEASRYYYASLFFSERIYGMKVPLSVLHPSRYLMQAIPFLIPHSPLWLHRLWQVFLWIATSLLAAWLLTRRIRSSATSLNSEHRPLNAVHWLLFTLFSFLFLLQGPVYYHLLVMVIAVLWGTRTRRFWPTLAVVLVASLWAGISRINWLPVPGMLAAALYFLEVPVAGQGLTAEEGKRRLALTGRLSSLAGYLLPPLAWVLLGTALGYLSQSVYPTLSGNPPEQFGSSLTSDLLWYRLKPNVTYPMGVLPSILLASLPFGLILALYLLRRGPQVHFLRWLGLASLLAVLFAGGLVVSVKIGGGSNLHNLDAYLALLLVIGSYAAFDRFAPEAGAPVPAGFRLSRALVLLALIPPVYFTVNLGGPLPQHDVPQAQAELEALHAVTQEASRQGGEVLFISQRHLLTFDEIPGVPLVPDYELVFLTEMGMSEQAPYLTAFYEKLRQHRFALIVTNPLSITHQGRFYPFGEENDNWANLVSGPVLCYYEPVLDLKEANVQVLAPRTQPCR